jgi:hypothetical protein
MFYINNKLASNNISTIHIEHEMKPMKSISLIRGIERYVIDSSFFLLANIYKNKLHKREKEKERKNTFSRKNLLSSQAIVYQRWFTFHLCSHMNSLQLKHFMSSFNIKRTDYSLAES